MELELGADWYESDRALDRYVVISEVRRGRDGQAREEWQQWMEWCDGEVQGCPCQRRDAEGSTVT